jgi:quercetin dioxygenase-like cupin family protein
MINFINKNDKLNENKNSLIVSYSRTINIIFGYYPYPEKIHSIILEIKNNLSPKMENFTNVKGGMTSWEYFIDKPVFRDFMTYLINKHQRSHPDLFEYFLEKNTVENAWGNEIKTGDSLRYHHHSCLHGILYLTKGCDLILPELNLKITPEPGDYYIFPPNILHGFDQYEGEKNRYSLIFNIIQKKRFEYIKKIEEKIKHARKNN